MHLVISCHGAVSHEQMKEIGTEIKHIIKHQVKKSIKPTLKLEKKDVSAHTADKDEVHALERQVSTPLSLNLE